MKKQFLLLMATCGLTFTACDTAVNKQSDATSAPSQTQLSGQSGVKDEVSSPNVVQVAMASPDHSTLVAAIQAANLVDALSNAGPFTVFAPTNAAFDKLPAGTLNDLLKPANRNTLSDILEYHVYVGVIKTEAMRDGQTLQQVNGKNINITMKDGKYLVNGKATIVASVNTSNGVIHVIDEVLLPPE
jgi:uncharacterized surface protein with fasciclin (FAS1) repeats